ncbi:MAG: ATP-binding protein [Ekhidna sp.]|uniref:ATP-binding protein n=1 Tax=Ekhidna sp. TaxID=2608089 RepID=UPI0032EB0D1A
MKKNTAIFSELDIRKLTIRIILAFLVGVTSVLAIAFVANRQVQKFAEVNSQLEQLLATCGKQRTLSQYLSKNVLLLDIGEAINPQVVERLDSAVSAFHANHLKIREANEFLAGKGIALEKIVSIYAEMSPSISALIKGSYGIQEARNVGLFRNIILQQEGSVMPLLNELSDRYQTLAEDVNSQLSRTISRQYWFIGITVILAATCVLTFTIQLVRIRVKSYRKHFEKVFDSQKRYENLTRGTRDVVYEMDGNGKYIYINPAFEKLFESTLNEVNQKKWYDYVRQDHREEVIRYYAEVIREQKPSCYYEFPIVTSMGDRKWIAQSTAYTYDKSGNVTNIYNIARDITGLRFNAEKEQKYKQGLRLLNELSSKTELSIQKRLEDGLKLCLEYLGLDVGIVSKIWMDEYRVIAFYPESSGLSLNQKYKLGDTYCDITLSEKGRVLSIDHMEASDYKNHPCFKKFNLQSYIGAAYRVEGKVAGTVNFTSAVPRTKSFSDYEIDFMNLVAKWVGSLMEQEENQNRLLEEQSLLKTFVSSAPVAIAMLDKHMNYISVSQKWCIDQNIPEDIIGKSHYKVFPEVPKIWKEMHKRALDGEIIKPGIEKFVRADGSFQWIQGEVHPWYTHKDKVGGIIIFFNDLTDMKRQEVELRKAKEEAEEAGKIKEQFLSTMSHEIRTPLNAIIGTTNLLELEHPELSGNSRLKMLKFGSNNLLTLINDILDFQKIESGNLEIVKEDVNLQDLVNNIIETWRAVPQSGTVSLVCQYDEGLSSHYICDEVRLTQVLNNLISNALKFTDQGKVEITIKPESDGKVYFSVNDTGIGIPEDKLGVIFETFKQINNQHSMKAGGTGLGLSISKRLVDLMGGQLQVSSIVSKGTNFYFSIPLEASHGKSASRKVDIVSTANLDIKVLLVEDNPANQEIAKSFLTRWGVEVDIANHGKEALEQVVSKKYDVILMDVRMPVMDGYEATMNIRSMDDEYFKTVPIIALTASTLAESRTKMESSGMNEIVSKPFDPRQLFEKVSLFGKAKPGTEVLKNEEVQHETDRTIARFKFLAEVLAGNEEKIHMIAEMAIKSIDDDLKGSREKMKKQDREETYNHLHKMKSNLANLDLRELAASMPDYKAEDFWENLPPFLDEVEVELARAKEYLVC